MNKLQTKIMNMDFKKTRKKFILLSLMVVIFGGILTGFMFRTQINEVITYHQTYENSSENEVQKDNREMPDMMVRTTKTVNEGMIMREMTFLNQVSLQNPRSVQRLYSLPIQPYADDCSCLLAPGHGVVVSGGDKSIYEQNTLDNIWAFFQSCSYNRIPDCT